GRSTSIVVQLFGEGVQGTLAWESSQVLRKSDVATLGNGRVLYLRGTPYEQGRQLGAGAADLIAQNVERARALVQQVATGFDLAAYTAMTRRNERWVSRTYPELPARRDGQAVAF
ncbi:MAG: hypothetical protein LC797_19595, partial [Chloroflexi bacterium]|nr:hypothetical protein [Chloroflexota bacterium]